MSEQFVGEIRIFGFNFAPRGWATCDGQILAIAQNTALFSLFGTQYGGNGTSNFALPNLQNVTPIDQGQGPGLSQRVVGEVGGVANVTLLTTTMASHTHPVGCLTSPAASLPSPDNAVWGGAQGRTPPPLYSNSAPNSAMNPVCTGSIGGNQPHNNLPPYLTLSFCIALTGVFPARN